jgi:hypothetical protein
MQTLNLKKENVKFRCQEASDGVGKADWEISPLVGINHGVVWGLFGVPTSLGNSGVLLR